jgi:protein-tyrosine phosphatase
MPRPRGGDWLEDEIRSLWGQGVDVLVSLLTPDEMAELALVNDAAASELLGIQFLSFAIDDRSVPANTTEALEFVHSLRQMRLEGTIVVIHCRAGIGVLP